MQELKKLWNTFTTFDKVYTILFTLSLIAVQLITDSTIVSLFCALLGIGHVILVRKGHKYAMLLGAIQSLIYCIISFNRRCFCAKSTANKANSSKQKSASRLFCREHL